MKNLPTYVVDTRQPDSDTLSIRVGFCRFKVCAESYEDAVQQVQSQHPHLQVLDPYAVSDEEDVRRAARPKNFGDAPSKPEGAIEADEISLR